MYDMAEYNAKKFFFLNFNNSFHFLENSFSFNIKQKSFFDKCLLFAD